MASSVVGRERKESARWGRGGEGERERGLMLAALQQVSRGLTRSHN